MSSVLLHKYDEDTTFEGKAQLSTQKAQLLDAKAQLSQNDEERGLPDADRAEVLGHSVETNIRHYTYESRECAEKMRKMLDQNEKGTIFEEKGTLNTIPFTKRKSPKHLSL